MYTLTIHDKKGVYADLTQSFTLYTDAMPAAYNEKGTRHKNDTTPRSQ